MNTDFLVNTVLKVILDSLLRAPCTGLSCCGCWLYFLRGKESSGDFLGFSFFCFPGISSVVPPSPTPTLGDLNVPTSWLDIIPLSQSSCCWVFSAGLTRLLFYSTLGSLCPPWTPLQHASQFPLPKAPAISLPARKFPSGLRLRIG